MNKKEITSAPAWHALACSNGHSRAILLKALLIHFSGGFWAVGMKQMYGFRCLSPCRQPEADDRKTSRTCSCSGLQPRSGMEAEQLLRFDSAYAYWFSECRFAQFSPILRQKWHSTSRGEWLLT